MWKILIRPGMVFIPFILGVLLPQFHFLGKEPYNIVRWTLCTMLFLSSLQLRFEDMKLQREHWIVTGLNLLMGLIPFLIFRFLFPSYPEYALAAFFVGITPTATAAPVVISFLNGRVGFALTGFVLSTVVISSSLLILLPFLTGNITIHFVLNIAENLLVILVIPFLLAMVGRKIYPPLRNLPKKCKMFSLALWSAGIFILAATASQYLKDHPEISAWRIVIVALISLLICICNFSLGKVVSRRRFSRESSQILGQKNTTFTMYLALQYAGAFAALGPIFYILWHNLWNAFQMYQYDLRRMKRQQRTQNQKS